MQVTPVPSLTLFGTPRLADPVGRSLTGRAVQRHRIALLALLACAHPRGRGREILLATLWSEHHTDSARKLLNQSVYVLRKALGEGAIVTELDELRLDLTFVSIDAVEFQACITRGDDVRAAALYAGPLLDGFFVHDAPEFDEWAARERSRFAGLYAKALERLAAKAAVAGDTAGAVEWWQARVAHDPFDSSATRGLMTALEAAGNRAGALAQARIHEQLLHDEFGTAPPPELSALVDRLRVAPPWAVPHADAAAPADVVRVAKAQPVDDAAPPTDTATPQRARRRLPLRFAIGAFLIAALVVGALQGRTSGGAESQTRASVAVLPLEHLGTDPGDAPLAAGMTDEVVTKLAQIPVLRVVGGSAVRSLVGRGLDARSVADSLHVDHVLEGGVQKAGDELRVRLRLVDVRDGSTLWSHTYQGVMSDIFALHDEIAQSVARELGVHLAGVSASAAGVRGTRSVAAYEHYLRGSDRTLLRSDSGARAGVEHFQRAVALDSGYAAAWAGLGRMYARFTSTVPRGERERYFLLARQAVERAIMLDDSLAEAHATLGVQLMRTFEWAAAERHFNRAVALDPERALTHEWLVALNLWLGRPDRALAHGRRALELEPLSPSATAEYAHALIGNDRCPEALEQLRKLDAVQPPLLRVAGMKAVCHARLEQWDEAIALLRPEGARDSSTVLLGFVLARAGRTDDALQIRNDLIEQWEAGEIGAFDVALQFAGSGEADETFVWLDRALEDWSLNGLPGLTTARLLFGPPFAQLHQDPRFGVLLERIGLQKR